MLVPFTFRMESPEFPCKYGKQPWAAFVGRNATWLAQFSIQQTDLTTFSEDGRGVKWLCN
jgi:hypothetical protein